MGIITTMKKQEAWYWPLGDPAVDENGVPAYGSVVSIDCRWQSSNEKYIGTDGETHISNTKVFPDRELDIGGRLLLKADVAEEAPTDGPLDLDTIEVRHFRVIPNLNVTETLYIALA